MVRECIKDIIDDIRSFFQKTDRLDILIEEKINSLQIYVLGFSHGYIIGLKSFGQTVDGECSLIYFINEVIEEYNNKKVSATETWHRISRLISSI